MISLCLVYFNDYKELDFASSMVNQLNVLVGAITNCITRFTFCLVVTVMRRRSNAGADSVYKKGQSVRH